MRCDFADSLLQGYFDGELSAFRAVEMERHIQHCAGCGAALVALDVLSGKLQLARLYETAPAALRQKIHAALRPVAPATAGSQLLLWHWLAAVAALLLVALVGWRVGPELRTDDYQAERAKEIVDAHLHSLQPGHTTGIASSDERAVKEWLEDKVKFALPVRNFAIDGFALQGGRLDVVEGRSVAALVYARRGHLINVFLWPTREPSTSPRVGSRQGFQWVDWRMGKMEFCAISDADPVELEQLHQLFATGNS